MKNSILIAAVICSSLALSAMTPAEQKIKAAETALAKPGANAASWASLAWAYVKRARETSDAKYFDMADAAASKGLALTADDFECLKARTAVLLGRGENQKALELARKLNKRTPDDILAYGLVADAAIALGQIKEAERAAQWMLDMRPGNVPGLLRGAELRKIFGDPDGALDFLNQAFRRVQPEETEERAYIATRMSDVLLAKGDTKSAVRAAEQSLKLFPDYPLGKKQLERVRERAETASLANAN